MSLNRSGIILAQQSPLDPVQVEDQVLQINTTFLIILGIALLLLITIIAALLRKSTQGHIKTETKKME